MMLLLHLYGADRAGIQVSRKHAKRDYGGGGGGGGGHGGYFHQYIYTCTDTGVEQAGDGCVRRGPRLTAVHIACSFFCFRRSGDDLSLQVHGRLEVD